MNNIGIYIIENKITSMQYIGSHVSKNSDITDRVKQHFLGQGGAPCLWRFIQEYGVNNFNIEFIFLNNKSSEEIFKLESKMIEFNVTKYPFGYNLIS